MTLHELGAEYTDFLDRLADREPAPDVPREEPAARDYDRLMCKSLYDWRDEDHALFTAITGRRMPRLVADQ